MIAERRDSTAETPAQRKQQLVRLIDQNPDWQILPKIDRSIPGVIVDAAISVAGYSDKTIFSAAKKLDALPHNPEVSAYDRALASADIDRYGTLKERYELAKAAHEPTGSQHANEQDLIRELRRDLYLRRVRLRLLKAMHATPFSDKNQKYVNGLRLREAYDSQRFWPGVAFAEAVMDTIEAQESPERKQPKGETISSPQVVWQHAAEKDDKEFPILDLVRGKPTVRVQGEQCDFYDYVREELQLE